MYKSCYIENVNGLWCIMWPDCTKAWSKGYKRKGWAVRTLKWLQEDS